MLNVLKSDPKDNSELHEHSIDEEFDSNRIHKQNRYVMSRFCLDKVNELNNRLGERLALK